MCADELAELEVDRESVSLGQLLGGGVSGNVYEGSIVGVRAGSMGRQQAYERRTTAGSGIRRVAVKMLREDCTDQGQQRQFVEEARRMSRLQDSSIVQLVAVCMRSRPYMIVLEHMEHGDLKAYLRGCRGQLSAVQMQRLSVDAGRGVAYLSKQGVVHRDVAARNVLVGEGMQAKLADFGACRECAHVWGLVCFVEQHCVDVTV